MRSRLILLPGLGANERLFSRLGKICMPVVTPRLPLPNAGESFTAYALRVAAQIELRPEDWIGGSSFGSLVAADIARRRPVAGLVLIGGAQSSESLLPAIRFFAGLSAFLPLKLLHPWVSRPCVLRQAFGNIDTEALSILSEMARATPVDLFSRGVHFLTHYQPRIPLLCPVHAIHGDIDRLLNPPRLPDCRIVAGAGHALPLTHPFEVTTFLDTVVCQGRTPGTLAGR